MKAAVLYRRGSQQERWFKALIDGFKRHGVVVQPMHNRTRIDGDFAVCWGWRNGQQFVQSKPVLVLERGYVDDRFTWTSLGWNGLNGRAQVPTVDDGGERWRRLFDHLLCPWKRNGEYVLLAGQVQADAACRHIDLSRWYGEAAKMLKRLGLPIFFRHHPVETQRHGRVRVGDVPNLHGTLEQALEKAALAVTFNSNVGVDAALAGVPVIACDEGSMAWPVAAHGFEEPMQRPDRSEWCARLAWRQWSEAELRSGEAWDHLKVGLATV